MKPMTNKQYVRMLAKRKDGESVQCPLCHSRHTECDEEGLYFCLDCDRSWTTIIKVMGYTKEGL